MLKKGHRRNTSELQGQQKSVLSSLARARHGQHTGYRTQAVHFTEQKGDHLQ